MHHLTTIPTNITLLIMLGFQPKLASFVFPKNSQKGMLGVIWSNEEKIKMVLESLNPSIVWEAFSPWKNLQTSWTYLEKIDSGSQTSFIPLEQLYLHWKRNNFTFIERASETISKEESKGVADCTQQQHDVQQDLFETDDNIQLDGSLDCRFWKNNQGSYWLSLKDWNIQLKHAITFYRSR